MEELEATDKTEEKKRERKTWGLTGRVNMEDDDVPWQQRNVVVHH